MAGGKIFPRDAPALLARLLLVLRESRQEKGTIPQGQGCSHFPHTRSTCPEPRGHSLPLPTQDPNQPTPLILSCNQSMLFCPRQVSTTGPPPTPGWPGTLKG